MVVLHDLLDSNSISSIGRLEDIEIQQLVVWIDFSKNLRSEMPLEVNLLLHLGIQCCKVFFIQIHIHIEITSEA